MEPSTKARRGNALELFYYLCAVYRYKLRPEYSKEMPHDVYCLIGREDLGLSYMLHDPRSWFPSRDTHTHVVLLHGREGVLSILIMYFINIISIFINIFTCVYI